MKCLIWSMALALTLSLAAGCERDHRKRAYEFLPEMVHPVPYEAFAPNPNTPDGKTLQRPVPGTIPRGFMPYPYPEDRERAGRELSNPLSKTDAVLARGKHHYQTFCLTCHGVQGKGDGPLIPKFPNPPSFTTKRVRNLSEGILYHVITMGAGQMESYASQIASDDRWTIVYYVQTLQGAGRSPESIEVEADVVLEEAPKEEPQP